MFLQRNEHMSRVQLSEVSARMMDVNTRLLNIEAFLSRVSTILCGFRGFFQEVSSSSDARN